MLATVIASTTAKPSMTLPRNRNVGSLMDIDRGHARFDNPTSNPRLLPKNQQNRERELPDPVLKIRAEWIRAGKFAPNPHAGAWLFLRDDRACPSHPGLFLAARRQDVDTPRSVYAKASPGSPASPPKLWRRRQAGHDEAPNKAPNFMAASGPSENGNHGVAASPMALTLGRPAAFTGTVETRTASQ